MTPKEKAENLIDKFCEYSHTDFNLTKGGYQFKSQIANAKQCALIAVNEIINSIPTQPSNLKMERLDAITFWMLVKEEIKTYGGNK